MYNFYTPDVHDSFTYSPHFHQWSVVPVFNPTRSTFFCVYITAQYKKKEEDQDAYQGFMSLSIMSVGK